MIAFAYTIKSRALAKLGELLKGLEKSKGIAGRDKSGQTRGSSGIPRVVEPPTYFELGIDKKTAAVAQQLAIAAAARLLGMSVATVKRWRRAVAHNTRPTELAVSPILARAGAAR